MRSTLSKVMGYEVTDLRFKSESLDLPSRLH